MTPFPGPGPRERKVWNRLWFRLFGFWPERVVRERLLLADLWRLENRRIDAARSAQ